MKVSIKFTEDQLQAMESVLRNRIESLEERDERDDWETIKVLKSAHVEISYRLKNSF
jgi:hypothetical protein